MVFAQRNPLHSRWDISTKGAYQKQPILVHRAIANGDMCHINFRKRQHTNYNSFASFFECPYPSFIGYRMSLASEDAEEDIDSWCGPWD